MRAADGRIEAAAGVEVVVHEIDTRTGKRLGLPFVHDAERDAELQVRELRADRPRGGGEVRDVCGARPAGAHHHAVAAGPARGGAARSGDELADGHEPVALDRRARDRRLRAVPAVLGAETAARVLQHAELHAPAPVPAANRERRPEERPETGVRAPQHRQRLLPPQGLVGQRARCERPVRPTTEKCLGRIDQQHRPSSLRVGSPIPGATVHASRWRPLDRAGGVA